MIVVTGASGFIGSALVWQLNESGVDDLVLIGRFGKDEKWKNLRRRNYHDWIDKDRFPEWVDKNGDSVEAIIHLGACSDTTENDVDYLVENNYEYSKQIWQEAVDNDIKLVYASSAATYGGGEHGYDDNVAEISKLKPLNPYGWSKQRFDRWALDQRYTPPQWVGLKFFNVFGPNEYHKGEMVSVVNKAFNQAVENGTIELFKSHRDEYGHGKQKRDFIYVKDVVDIIEFFLNADESGIFNVGTGTARTYDDLATAVIDSVNSDACVEYIDMPPEIRDQYQYYTEARIGKLLDTGYDDEFYSLEAGIEDYVGNYLTTDDPYL